MRPISAAILSVLAILMPVGASAEASKGTLESIQWVYRARLEKFGAVLAQHRLCVGQTSKLSEVTVAELSQAKEFGMTIDEANGILRDSEIMVRAEMSHRCTNMKDRIGDYNKVFQESIGLIEAERKKAAQP